MGKYYRSIRFDYGTVYAAGGADALNRLLAERYPDSQMRGLEINGMPRRGGWIIAYDCKTGLPFIVGRKAVVGRTILSQADAK